MFTVFRLEFEARKRSAASKVLPSTINQLTHIQDTHTHDTHTYIYTHCNNSNNNLKYACALLDQIQFSEAEAKGGGEMREGAEA